MVTGINAISLSILASIIGAFGGFFFKRGSAKLRFNFFALLRNRELIFGTFLFGLGAIVYIISLSLGELNVVYPISSLTYVWSTFLAKKYLNEKINAYKWSGIALVVLGTISIVN